MINEMVSSRSISRLFSIFALFLYFLYRSWILPVWLYSVPFSVELFLLIGIEWIGIDFFLSVRENP